MNAVLVRGHICDVYPVGLWLYVKDHGPIEGVRRWVRYVARQARRHDWRAIKMTLNGYLCEPTPWPEIGLRRCGTGWTPRLAARSLERLIEEATGDTDD